MKTKEVVERIGLEIDRIDNCVAGLDMPVSAKIHVESLAEILPEISKNLKKCFYELGGDKNTWEQA